MGAKLYSTHSQRYRGGFCDYQVTSDQLVTDRSAINALRLVAHCNYYQE